MRSQFLSLHRSLCRTIAVFSLLLVSGATQAQPEAVETQPVPAPKPDASPLEDPNSPEDPATAEEPRRSRQPLTRKMPQPLKNRQVQPYDENETKPETTPTRPDTELPKKVISATLTSNARQNADRLVSESRTAFQRGLMSLPQYVTHLNMALELRGGVGNETDQETILQSHLSEIRDALQRLERFQQPASSGWRADVAYARMLSLQTQLKLDQLQDPESVEDLQSQIDQQARLHWNLRMDDYRTGQAGLSEVVTAAEFLMQSDGNREQLSDYQSLLERLASAPQNIASPFNASGGPETLRQQAQIQLLRWQVNQLGGNAGTLTANQTELVQEANTQTAALFTRQLNNAANGTADLFELSQTIRLRQQFQKTLPGSSSDSLQNDMQQLKQLADNTRDLRGKNQANVTFVRSLQLMQEIEAP